MKTSTKDRARGHYEEAKGKLKQKTAGKDATAKRRGIEEQARGKIRRKMGEMEKVGGR